MSLRPPISTLTDSLFTYTTLFRSKGQAPRIHDLADPINTIVACGGRQALIQAGVIHQDIRGANSEPGSNASLSHAKRSEENTSELQSLMRISYAVFCLKKKKNNIKSYEH